MSDCVYSEYVNVDHTTKKVAQDRGWGTAGTQIYIHAGVKGFHVETEGNKVSETYVALRLSNKAARDLHETLGKALRGVTKDVV